MAIASTFKKYAKALILPVACYSLISFFPSFVSSNNTVDLSKLSASQIKSKYESELYSAVRDNELRSSEVEKLHGLLANYFEAKDGKLVAPIKNLDDVKAEDTGYKKVVVNGGFFYVKKTEDTKTEDTEHKKVVVNDSIDSIIQDFEQKILVRYPELCSKNTPLKYDAFRAVKEGGTLKELIERAYQITEKQVPEYLDKECYEVRDLVVFNDFLESLKSKNISTSPEIRSVENLNLSDDQFRFVKSSYKAYLDARDKEFAKAKKYWGAGVDMVDNANLCHVGLETNFFKKEMVMVEDVKKALKLQGYTDVDISKFYKGVGFKGRFPQIPNWAIFAFGLGFPFLRTGLITRYTRRQYDPGDIMGNFLSSLLGGLIFDSFHPLVFPIRMFASPFIFEPIRKVSGCYEKKY